MINRKFVIFFTIILISSFIFFNMINTVKGSDANFIPDNDIYAAIPSQYPNDGLSHYLKIDDAIGNPDDSTSYIYKGTAGYAYDIYRIPDHTVESGVITNVRVYHRSARGAGTTTMTSQAVIRHNGADYFGNEEGVSSSTYTTFYYDWAVRPNDGQSWTWTDIDNLGIGVQLQRVGTTGNIRCTQVYAVVTYISNTAPLKPTCVLPLSSSTNVTLSTTLKVHVEDPESNPMTVSFYWANNYTLIQTKTDCASGSDVETNALSGLNYFTVYTWYANASDGSFTTKSDDFNFRTAAKPDKPACVYPTDASIKNLNSLKLKCHVIDNDGDSLEVKFYWANNHTLISTKYGSNDSDVESDTINLNWGTAYLWYVNVSDGALSDHSDTFTFRTNYLPEKATCVFPVNNSNQNDVSVKLKCHIVDFDNDEMTVGFYWANNDTLIETFYGIANNSDIEITNALNLNYGTEYLWYVVANESDNPIKFTMLLLPVGDESIAVENAIPYGLPHYDNMNDNNNNTYIYMNVKSYTATDIYAATDHTSESGIITNVRVYVTGYSTWDGHGYIYPSIKTDGSVYDGDGFLQYSSYTTNYYDWAINPKTNLNWTWGDIDALGIGVKIGISSGISGLRCSEVYAIVDTGGILEKSYFKSDDFIFTTKYIPEKPICIYPVDATNNVPFSVKLKAHVIDWDSNDLTVKFFWSNDTLIETFLHATNDSDVELSDYLNLDSGTTYGWYATVNDSELENISDVFTFTTKFVPQKPVCVYPPDLSDNIQTNIKFKVHAIDWDSDDLSVYFYWDNDTLIQQIDHCTNNSDAETDLISLLAHTEYKWYAIVNDSELENVSDVFTFTTLDNPPDKPTVIYPVSPSFGIPLSIKLKCHVIDFDNDEMNVKFYWENNTLIENFNNVANNSDVELTDFLNLLPHTVYKWYVIVNDSILDNTSDLFIFTTLNNPPNIPICVYPLNASTNIPISIKLKTHVIDIDNDNIDVYFYWANNDTLISVSYSVVNDSDVESSTINLDFGIDYSWYVEVFDDSDSNISDNFTFTTSFVPNKPEYVYPGNSTNHIPVKIKFQVYISDFDNEDLTVSFYWINNTLIDTIYDCPNDTDVESKEIELEYGMYYEWYATANDSVYENISDIFSFTTAFIPQVPEIIYPPDTSNNIPVSVKFKCHVIDWDDDDLEVSFYWSNDTLIQTISHCHNDSDAETNTIDLLPHEHYKWYVIVNDTVYENTSIIASFDTVNNPPDKPTCINPVDLSPKNDISVNLIVHVIDIDGDNMNVYFYWSNHTLIDALNDWINDTDATSLLLSLEYGKTYSWYVVVNDSYDENVSDVFTFTTEYLPEKPNNPYPSDDSRNIPISVKLKIHVIDWDDDDFDVYFYWSDDTLITYVTHCANDSDVKTDLLALDYNNTYYWYAVIVASMYDNTSDIFNFRTKIIPDKPVCVYPLNGSTKIPVSLKLKVFVVDNDNQLLNVSFYWGNNTLIQTVDNCPNGSIAETLLLNLDYNTFYTWYAVVNDSELQNISDIFEFTTGGLAPDKPICVYPLNSTTDIPINTTLICHVVDIDGDNMTVSFYWFNNTLIETIYDCLNDTDVNTSELNLSYGNIYQWYATSHDGTYEVASDVFIFATEGYIPPPPPYEFQWNIGYILGIIASVFLAVISRKARNPKIPIPRK